MIRPKVQGAIIRAAGGTPEECIFKGAARRQWMEGWEEYEKVLLLAGYGFKQTREGLLLYQLGRVPSPLAPINRGSKDRGEEATE